MKIDNMLSDAELTKACRQLRSYKVQQYRSFENSVGFENSKVDAAVERTIHRYEILQQLKKWWINLITIGVSFSLLGSTIAYANPGLFERLGQKLIYRVDDDQTLLLNFDPEESDNSKYHFSCNIGWIPEGFKIEKYEDTIHFERFIYKNDSDQWICVTCANVNSGMQFRYTTLDRTILKKGTYKDYEYIFIYKDNYSKMSNLIATNDNDVLIIIDSHIDDETSFKILDSIEVISDN